MYHYEVHVWPVYFESHIWYLNREYVDLLIAEQKLPFKCITRKKILVYWLNISALYDIYITTHHISHIHAVKQNGMIIFLLQVHLHIEYGLTSTN